MTGSTPPRKRRFPLLGADQGPSDGSHGARDDERGSPDAGASLEPATGRQGASASGRPAPIAWRQAAVVRDKARGLAREGVRMGGSRARAGLAYLTDRIIEIAPRVLVRDLDTLRRQFPGLGPEQLADKLVAGAATGTSTVGAGIGAAAMLPVPPAMPTELAAEITGVAAIELKLIAELHEVYGVRPPGNLKARSTAYLSSWSGERGIDVMKPSTINTALGGQMKRELRQQIMKRMVRDMPNLMPFMVGAVVGAVMNRRDTRRLAARIRADLRKIQVPWDELPELPPLEQPADPLEPGTELG
ncbi:EcsC family protein [Streptomyces sp. NK08204]|uniref:EcsC family protein n=1 Tax=Streptomyces sp. NK08204 TaxID=2873260 RepID=UPI001CEC9939|nr:EcsC family protein [Streptomyces sp. NK08204]